MSKIPSITDLDSIDCYPSIGDEDILDIGERFIQGFSSLLERKKEQALVEVLREEFPQLADDPVFIRRVLDRLGNEDIIEEKRFVFLSLNPNLKR